MLTKISLSLGPNSTNISFKNSEITTGPDLFKGEELRIGLVERVLKACCELTKVISLSFDGECSVRCENKDTRFIL